ncbi:MAG: FliA/WhiG family RNA polymerase sigma factor [Deltaproteobacteria bacterium]|nr:FliA/WhiG family RNA polymerase sigma factor [Deltaproteobacteria bacterium]MBW2069711.1 FliA/WhiG family RNA polymerase sigma factor [Deltaproteobacteria bacterium]
MVARQQPLGKLKSYQNRASHKWSAVDSRQREALILEFAPLIKPIAARLANRLPPSVSMDDLMSAGVIGLIDAIEKFDPAKQVQFKTYAEFRIRGAMIDELRQMDWVPRSVRKKAHMLARAYEAVEGAKGGPAEPEEVAAALGEDMEGFYQLLQEVRGLSLITESELARMCPDLKCDSLLSLLSGENGNGDPLQALGLAELRQVLAAAIEQLPEKERLVVTLYYYEELTMREIALVMNYTESRISQLQTQAVLRLRRKLHSYFPEKKSRQTRE